MRLWISVIGWTSSVLVDTETEKSPAGWALREAQTIETAMGLCFNVKDIEGHLVLIPVDKVSSITGSP